ncbi:MAG: TraR/DksA C4-type zinc finger protein [Anaerolineae bacterium]|jgi:DnaK suppressor protein
MPFSYERARQELLKERGELQEQLRQLESDEYEGVGYGNHMADDGTEAFEQTVGVGFRRRVEFALERVSLALTKLDDGTYGICEDCGGRIDRARLEALPQAVYCLECQAEHEHRA